VHRPDPIADALKSLASRIAALEKALMERSDAPLPEPPTAEVRALRPARGPNPAGG
jgi:serine O-acetyltransferase